MIFNPVVVGKKLPAIENPGSAADLLAGKQLIDQDGNPLTGTMPEVEQAVPSISVASNGVITASATQSGGKVAAGTKSRTHQLSTQAGTTITPGASRKTAVSSGRYTTGNVYVEGSYNLSEWNIKKGVSIFGVSGKLQEIYPKILDTLYFVSSSPTELVFGSNDANMQIYHEIFGFSIAILSKISYGYLNDNEISGLFYSAANRVQPKQVGITLASGGGGSSSSDYNPTITAGTAYSYNIHIPNHSGYYFSTSPYVSYQIQYLLLGN